MKVYVTGQTNNQMQIRRPKNMLYSNALAVLEALEQLGVDYVNGFEENPLEYDCMLYGMYSAVAMATSGKAPLTMQQLNKQYAMGGKIVLFLDDWHLTLIRSGYRRSLNHPDKALDFINRGKYKLKAGELALAMHIMFNSDVPILMPVLPWLVNDDETRESCAVALEVDPERLVMYDPTLLFTLPDIQQDWIDQPKNKQWILSSRYDFSQYVDKKMKPHWPVEKYGHAKSGCKIIPHEIDLLEVYAKNWGVISHPYPVALRGQWRNRFLFANAVGSVVHAVGREIKGMESIFPSVKTIESMNSYDLRALAQEQFKASTSGDIGDTLAKIGWAVGA